MDIQKLKIIDLKNILRTNRIKPLTGNKADLIQRIVDNNIIINPNDYPDRIKSSKGRKPKKMIPYDYDNMTVLMLKKLLKSYMLKMTGKKQDLINRIKAHVSKQDDEDFNPLPKSSVEPTLEELEAIELPKYIPTKLLLPKEKKVPDKVADEAVVDIETIISRFSDIGKNVTNSLTDFYPNNVISDIAFLYVCNKYNKKSIIITTFSSGLKKTKYSSGSASRSFTYIGMDVNIPDIRSIEYKNGIFMNVFGNEIDLDEFVEKLSNVIQKYNEDAICIPFTFHKRSGNIDHANLLIYRPREKILEWFEPHGQINKMKDKIYTYLQKGLIRLINLPIFKELIGSSHLVETHILVNESKYGTKALQGKNGGPTCALWCILISEMVFLNPQLSTPEIIRDMFDLTQGQRESINNIMKGYILEIEKELTKYLDEFNMKSTVGQVRYTRTRNTILQDILENILIPRTQK